MSKGPEQTTHQGSYTNDQSAHEKMLNPSGQGGNGNQNHDQFTLHTQENGKNQKERQGAGVWFRCRAFTQHAPGPGYHPQHREKRKEKKTTMTSVLARTRTRRHQNLTQGWWGWETVEPLGKTVSKFLQRLNLE